MTDSAHPDRDLSRRERQIMDILYSRGPSSAAHVMDALPDPPSYSAVRAMLRILEEKGVVLHEKQGPRYVYSPVVSQDDARSRAMQHTLSTFFRGSVSEAVAALLDASESRLTESELKRLESLIRARTQSPESESSDEQSS